MISVEKWFSKGQNIFIMDFYNFPVEKLAVLLETHAIIDAHQMVWIVLETTIGHLIAAYSTWRVVARIPGRISLAQQRTFNENRCWLLSGIIMKRTNGKCGVDGIEVDSFFLRLPWSREQHLKNLERLANRIATSQNDGSNHAT